MSYGIQAKVALFSSARQIQQGIYLKDDVLVFKMFDGSQEQYPLDMIKIPGLHNVEKCYGCCLWLRVFADAAGPVLLTLSLISGVCPTGLNSPVRKRV